MQIFDPALLRLPFYDDKHRALALDLERWVGAHWELQQDTGVCPRERGRRYTRLLGQAGWFAGLLSANASERPDLRSICLMREAFAYLDDLVDFAFSIQSLAISTLQWFGSSEQKAKFVEAAVRGELVGALALSESSAGSDLGTLACEARLSAAGVEITGEKCWVSNGDIADFCCLLARTGEGPGALGLSMFVVPLAGNGAVTHQSLDLIAPRAFAHLHFDQCRVGPDNVIGESGFGFRYALQLLDFYRVSVGAAALGFSRRARASALEWSKDRKVAGGNLLSTQLTQSKFAEIDLRIHGAALFVARAAWEFDSETAGGSPRHAAMAKLYATEAAQEVIDEAVQLHGAGGLIDGSITGRLYRQIRSLRIYEGTSDIQRMIIAGGIKTA